MRLWLLVLLGVSTSLAATAEKLPLPKWSDEELKKLKKGELIPGMALLVDSADQETTRVIPKLVKEELPKLPPQPHYDPKTIPDEHLLAYFQQKPKGYLVDPQRILTMQETMDRVGFLEYHADDSDIDIRLYLFDALQAIPAPHSLESLVEQRYGSGDPVVVVFFFVGDPSRTTMAFGGRGAADVDSKEVRRILASAKLKSLEQSEPSEQVEAFIVELSIKLFWLEKSIREAQAVADTAAAPALTQREQQRAGAGNEPKISSEVLYLLVGAVGVGVALLAMSAGIWLWWSNQRYRFPVLEPPGRLGADYGAGVGAVLGFSDMFGSPASQRDQVPDY